MELSKEPALPVHDPAHLEITIRALKDYVGAEQFQELTRLVWGSDPVDVVPSHVTVTAVKNGGMLLGAFAPDGPEESGGMVGAAFGWLGIGHDPTTPHAEIRLKFCSHMVGVLPAWQGKHVGLRLKLAQREAVLAQGLTDWMTWTYDPLYRANGVFNIHRLGATCATYIRNAYGELQDDLNRGMPSDRFQVDWRLASSHVLHELGARRDVHAWEATRVNLLPMQTNAAGLSMPVEAPLSLDGHPLAVPLPADISLARQADPALALAWRFYLRDVIEAAFSAGYTVVDCVHLGEYGWRYILVREYL